MADKKQVANFLALKDDGSTACRSCPRKPSRPTEWSGSAGKEKGKEGQGLKSLALFIPKNLLSQPAWGQKSP
ncbi:MAG: hypothetical protein FJ134_16810 [Deltaproteobacteria bacterium]|nr:hypothetical protein [Deltaproteobacteria bacterium]